MTTGVVDVLDARGSDPDTFGKGKAVTRFGRVVSRQIFHSFTVEPSRDMFPEDILPVVTHLFITNPKELKVRTKKKQVGRQNSKVYVRILLSFE